MGKTRSFWDWDWEDVYSPGSVNVARVLETQRLSQDFVATLRRAAWTAKLARSVADPPLAETLTRFVDETEKLTGHWSTVQDLILDARAVGSMVKAWNATDKQAIIRDPHAAAVAFGQLFASAGRIARHLPPPLNAFGSFLEGLETVIAQTQANMTYGAGTQHGKQMQDVFTQGGMN
jgi:hypothetical protein